MANTNFHGRVSGTSLLIRQTIMLFYITFLLLPVIIITLDGQICNAQATICNRNFNYTKGSMFESNLNTVFNRLVQNTSQTGYNTSVYGQIPNQIYGLLNCRGDTTTEQCYNCSQRAIAAIQQSEGCGNGVGGTIWMDDCFLRYENYTFSGKLSSYGLNTYITTTVPEPEVFNSSISNLLSNLSSKAESGYRLYAYGITNDSLSRKIYGLVQCWRDISSDDCTICLSNTINSILVTYPGNPGVQGLMANCIVRYEIYPFFNSILPLPPAATPQLPPYPVAAPQFPPYPVAAPPLPPSPERAPDNTPSSYDCWTKCNSTSIYKKGSAFETNLKSVLKDLVQNTSKKQLFGQSPDQIHGSLECLQAATADQCYSCSQQATASTGQCGNAVGATTLCLPICSLRYATYNFSGITSTVVFNPFLPPPPPPLLPETPADGPVQLSNITNNRKSSHRLPIILGVVGGFLLALFLLVCATGRRLKSTMKRRGYEATHSEGRGQVEEDTLGQVEEDTLISEDPQLVAFKMETLLAATDNFHDDNKLGEGGFGPVYKGTTGDGKEMAVKKMSLNSAQGKKEFLNEVKLVAKIQHRNLVKLLGYCAEGSKIMLVYEYLPNKSLDKILFNPNNRKHLDWQKRYNIVLGVARGLLYLHQDSLLRIIHRDIKASNILLDEKLNPKIADFGLAKHFPEDESHVSTRLAGTFGYMAPEYAMQGQLSVKSDVYSFGVLLLEIITGRKNTDYSLSPEMQILLGWAWRSYERGNIVQMIDPAIIETCDEELALRCIHVGLLCTQAEASLRPPMSTATLMLSSDSVMLPNPTKPVFVSSRTQITNPTILGSGSSHASASTDTASSLTPLAPASNANVSINDLEPR